MKIGNRTVLLLLFASGLFWTGSTQTLDFDQPLSQQEFRNGVVAFHGGLFNKAILAFEKSINYKPDEPLTRFWLGQALYYAGFEEAALNEWSNILKTGMADPVLGAWVEIVRGRRGLSKEILSPDRFVTLYETLGTAVTPEGKPLFLRPSSVRPLPTGGYVVAGFATGDVLEFNYNGRMVRRFIGGLERFLGPFDVLPLGKEFLVSEYLADRISLVDGLGIRSKVIGTKGRGAGQLLGPQYLASDGQGSFFVTEWGNRRVSKFTHQGEFLFSFGGPLGDFPGLSGPSGIAYLDGRVYVADRGRKTVEVFDISGNHENTFTSDQLNSPEGLAVDARGRLFLADGKRVFFIRTDSGILEPFDPEWEQGAKVMLSAPDLNGNLLVADFDMSRIRVLTESAQIYSGLVPRIVRIVSDTYPKVYVEVEVEDSFGKPVVGLETSNFIINESRTQVLNIAMDQQPYASKEIEVSVLVDQMPIMADYRPQTAEAVTYLGNAMGSRGGMWLYNMSAVPVQDGDKSLSVMKQVQLATDPQAVSPQVRFDLSLRLAASQLIPNIRKKAVFFVTGGGELSPDAFSQYDLVEMANYLRSNAIRFTVVKVGSHPLAPEVDYLRTATGGDIFDLASPTALGGIIESLENSQTGKYVLTYQSITPPEFGTRYIPLGVEVKHFKKSGRTELGYFAPRSNR